VEEWAILLVIALAHHLAQEVVNVEETVVVSVATTVANLVTLQEIVEIPAVPHATSVENQDTLPENADLMTVVAFATTVEVLVT
jgi:hypothetical protein